MGSYNRQEVEPTSKGDTNITINNQTSSSSESGCSGFSLALWGLFLFWIPIFGLLLSLAGLITSFFGLFSNSENKSGAGFVISIIALALSGAVTAFIIGKIEDSKKEAPKKTVTYYSLNSNDAYFDKSYLSLYNAVEMF